MTYDIPQQHNPNNNVNTSAQSAPAEKQSMQMQRGGMNQMVKEAMLRRLVDGSIKQNESKNVITGVEILDAKTNRAIVSHNADAPQFAASLNKLPVTLLVLHDLQNGTLKFDQTIEWQASDVRDGAGVFDKAGAPMKATIKDLLFDMLNRSGNTAVRVLVNYGLGGADKVNQRFATVPELSHTRLDVQEGGAFYLGSTAPSDALWSLKNIMVRYDQYERFMKDALATNIYTDYGVRSQLAGNDYITLVNKVGILDDPAGDNRHDVGYVYNEKTGESYAYSFMTTANGKYQGTDQAEQSLKDMGKGVLRFSGDKKSNPNQHPNKPQQSPRTESRFRY